MENCIFCKIAKKEIETNIIKEGMGWVAFEDVNPQAPVHVLVIPTDHIVSLKEVDDEKIIGGLMIAVSETAAKLGLKENGYRVVNNVGEYGGQTVPHLHFHILGGRQMGWPPG
ncbi:MAG: histidine triad nucleotide-binding protein [Spirochaetia bacterium]|nr:histidine triad nucleotide-binding protein [Spirochaetia bacterium]